MTLAPLEREFDVTAMTASTLVNLFKLLGLKPERALGMTLADGIENGYMGN